jgi:hypothetical protein
MTTIATSRMSRSCEYLEHTETENSLRRRVQELEELVAHLADQGFPSPYSLNASESSNNNTNNNAISISASLSTSSDPSQHTRLLRSFFLDPDIPRLIKLPPFLPDLPIPDNILQELGGQVGIHQTKSQYFSSSHTWMPFISRLRVGRAIDTALQNNKINADLTLLLLSMRLVEEVSTDGLAPEDSPIYITAKQFAATLENAGCYSMLKLQASLLITVYELGHAIFPAAYMSIGYCARQGIMLGFHDQKAPQMLRSARNWQEWEERQRAWWFIVILDR